MRPRISYSSSVVATTELSSAVALTRDNAVPEQLCWQVRFFGHLKPLCCYGEAVPWLRAQTRVRGLSYLVAFLTLGVSLIFFLTLADTGAYGAPRTDFSKHVSVQHKDKVYGVAFSPDSKYLATASADKTACIWEVETGDEVQCVSHKSPVNAVAFSPDGDYLATASDDGTARLWDATSGEEASSSPIEPGGKLYGVAFSPDGQYLATASDNGNAGIWNTSNGKEETSASPIKHGGKLYGVAFSPEGEYLATAGDDGAARIWDATNGKEETSISPVKPGGKLYGVAFSPDGEYLATASTNKQASLWSMSDGKEVSPTALHSDKVYGVAFNPTDDDSSTDVGQLATASADKTASTWKSPSISKVGTVTHKDMVYGVALSPDGKYLATGSADKTASILELASSQIKQTLAVSANMLANIQKMQAKIAIRKEAYASTGDTQGEQNMTKLDKSLEVIEQETTQATPDIAVLAAETEHLDYLLNETKDCCGLEPDFLSEDLQELRTQTATLENLEEQIEAEQTVPERAGPEQPEQAGQEKAAPQQPKSPPPPPEPPPPPP